ncbi:MAG TPA: hypothetical protein VLH61_09840 [Bacteroidales bacterium]|nr:hypothetical protein [Bacteroidales bacterium]
MSRIFTSLILFALFIGLASKSFAQRGFEYYATKEGILIQYRWSRQNPVDPLSNAALSFRLTNQNEFPVIVALSVNFYRDKNHMFESKDNHYCIEPGQSLRGALAHMRFMAEGVTIEMTQEPWFSWDITGFSLKQVDSCR